MALCNELKREDLLAEITAERRHGRELCQEDFKNLNSPAQRAKESSAN
jgi:hypothetical protein